MELGFEWKLLGVGMRQVEPTHAQEFRSQIRVGKTVKGRVVKLDECKAIVEIGNGVRSVCALTSPTIRSDRPARGSICTESSLRAMLKSGIQARPWCA